MRSLVMPVVVAGLALLTYLWVSTWASTLTGRVATLEKMMIETSRSQEQLNTEQGKLNSGILRTLEILIRGR